MTTRPSDESLHVVRRPFVIRAWLDGEITTREALVAAALSDDPAVRLWGHFLAGEYAKALVAKPFDFLRITNC